MATRYQYHYQCRGRRAVVNLQDLEWQMSISRTSGQMEPHIEDVKAFRMDVGFGY